MELPPPSKLAFTGNLAENWKKWKTELELYLIATERDLKSDKVKVSTLLHVIGDEGREAYSTFQFANEEEKNTWTVVLQKFDERCNPRENELFYRYLLWKAEQKPEETVDMFATRLKKLAGSCGYANQTDMIVRDRIVFGIKDDVLRERLLRWEPTSDMPELTLAKTIKMVRTSEITKEQMKKIAEHKAGSLAEGEVDLQAIHKKQFPRAQSRPAVKYNNTDISCSKCGKRHQFRQCPAFGRTCYVCKKRKSLWGGMSNEVQEPCARKHR